MTAAMDGYFSSREQARKVWNDLLASGIPRDHIFVDDRNGVIRVVIPLDQRRAIQQIFDRHRITS